ncbi:MAG: hypothetical protein NTW03_05395 [Verrucomicrobia bacterium]|nr:hypothetical protein [Verrucomicrobiota bacterium]
MESRKVKSDTVRVQLDFPKGKLLELQEIMTKTGMATRKDLFENAITLFEWAVDQRERGRMIASINEHDDTFRELVMPALAAVKASKHEAEKA